MANLQATTIDGTLNTTGQYSQGGLPMATIVNVTPSVTNVFYNGAYNSSITLEPSSISASARYVFCDVFVSASAGDHQNFVFSRVQTSATKNWVDSRGGNPVNEFGNVVATESVLITDHGDSDGYAPNYGKWYPCLFLPTSGRTVWINNYGNNGWFGGSASTGYLYFIVKGYTI